MINCNTCHRVFHLSCHKDEELKKNESDEKDNNRDLQDEKVEENKEVTNEKEVSNEKLVSNNEKEDDIQQVENKNSNVSTNVDEITVLSDDVTSSGEQVTAAICSVCRLLQKEDDCKLSKDEMNYLLNFTLNRIKIWVS